METNCTSPLVLSSVIGNVLRIITCVELSITIVGLVLNTINIVVLANAKLNESPYTYLFNLALSDLITLTNTLLNCIIQNTDIFGSKIIYLLNKFYLILFNNIALNCSIYLTLAITSKYQEAIIHLRLFFCIY